MYPGGDNGAIRASAGLRTPEGRKTLWRYLRPNELSSKWIGNGSLEGVLQNIKSCTKGKKD